ncbi:MAG: molybdenum cofactor biosynthesis protein MoaE [Chromatiales bacterium 21-64-14]|nr:MAG: molybdenum cofactor biosynthesis protein MoaE [Chromatiales bacterium 21-64-14]HQU16127.1 molybdenum cofactor biosynthesis protein MoaE [Gammaproteobacteria bacterium]
MTVRVQSDPFDPAAVLADVAGGDPGAGAVVSFIGRVRDSGPGGPVSRMTLEHYPGMTEQALADIEAQARARWELRDVQVIHRVGLMTPGEPIVLVAVASMHRGAAFSACEFIVDLLKTQAPFWKQEQTPEGTRWVEARLCDTETARRWEDGEP